MVGIHDDQSVKVACRASDDDSTHRRVVDIGVAGEQDHVGLFPAQVIHLLACGGQPLCINAMYAFIVVLFIYEILWCGGC